MYITVTLIILTIKHIACNFGSLYLFAVPELTGSMPTLFIRCTHRKENIFIT